MYLKSLKDDTIVVDIYDSERVPQGPSGEYYITPKRLALIDKWIIEEDIPLKIHIKDYLEFFLNKGWVGKY